MSNRVLPRKWAKQRMPRQSRTAVNAAPPHFPHWDLRRKNIVPNCKGKGQIDPYRVFLLIGSKGTGKTLASFNLMYRFREHYQTAIAITPNGVTAGGVEKLIGDSRIYDNWPDDFQEYLEVAAKERDKSLITPILIYIDDMAGNDEFMNSKTMKFIISQTRHLKIILINACQDIRQTKMPFRTQVDYAIAGDEDNEDNLRMLHKSFFGPIRSNFCNVFMSATEERRMMVKDGVYKGEHSDRVFIFKSKMSWALATEEEIEEATKEEKEDWIPIFNPIAEKFRYCEKESTKWMSKAARARNEAVMALNAKQNKEAKKRMSSNGLVTMGDDPLDDEDESDETGYSDRPSKRSRTSLHSDGVPSRPRRDSAGYGGLSRRARLGARRSNMVVERRR